MLVLGGWDRSEETGADTPLWGQGHLGLEEQQPGVVWALE